MKGHIPSTQTDPQSQQPQQQERNQASYGTPPPATATVATSATTSTRADSLGPTFAAPIPVSGVGAASCSSTSLGYGNQRDTSTAAYSKVTVKVIFDSNSGRPSPSRVVRELNANFASTFGSGVVSSCSDRYSGWSYPITFANPEIARHLLGLSCITIQGVRAQIRKYRLKSPYDQEMEAILAPHNIRKDITISIKHGSSATLINTSVMYTLKITNDGSRPFDVYYVRRLGSGNFYLHKPRTGIIAQTILPEKSKIVNVEFKSAKKGTFTAVFIFDTSIGSAATTMFCVASKLKPPCQKAPTTVDAPKEESPKFLRVDFFKNVAEAKSSHIHNKYLPYEWSFQPPEYELPSEFSLEELSQKIPPRAVNPWAQRQLHKNRLHDLLWIEEAQSLHDLEQYSILKASLGNCLTQDGKQGYSVTVPGIAESRPSVQFNDEIYASNAQERVEYQGYVVGIKNQEVIMQFSDIFVNNFQPSKKYDIRFSFDRMSMRILHWAVDNTSLDQIWPNILSIEEPSAPTVLNGLSTQFTFDREQMMFIQNCFKRSSNNTPQVVSGPFGSGKTATLVEIIKLLLLSSNNKILVATPTNSAADSFVLSLSKILPLDYLKVNLLRLVYFRRHRSTVPSFVLPFTIYDDKLDMFSLPPLSKLLQYKIIITTSLTAAYLAFAGVGKDFFTHIILDEAAQMSEPDALVALSLATSSTRVFLSGDAKQLSSRVRSRTARKMGLQTSLLERILALDAYMSDTQFQTHVQLYSNYRSHPGIVQLCSEIFYGGTIKPINRVENPKYNWLISWKPFLSKPSNPVAFVASHAPEQSDPDSPSFFNAGEAQLICSLIQEVLSKSSDLAPDPSDIAVVCPFQLQKKKVREVLRAASLSRVSVLGVDEIQGQEKKIIFVSCVRSEPSNVKKYDQKFDVGFINNPKRVNTTFSRAKDCLVIVGNPNALCCDNLWKTIIGWCKENANYKEVPKPSSITCPALHADIEIPIISKLSPNPEMDFEEMNTQTTPLQSVHQVCEDFWKEPIQSCQLDLSTLSNTWAEVKINEPEFVSLAHFGDSWHPYTLMRSLPGAPLPPETHFERGNFFNMFIFFPVIYLEVKRTLVDTLYLCVNKSFQMELRLPPKYDVNTCCLNVSRPPFALSDIIFISAKERMMFAYPQRTPPPQLNSSHNLYSQERANTCATAPSHLPAQPQVQTQQPAHPLPVSPKPQSEAPAPERDTRSEPQPVPKPLEKNKTQPQSVKSKTKSKSSPKRTTKQPPSSTEPNLSQNQLKSESQLPPSQTTSSSTTRSKRKPKSKSKPEPKPKVEANKTPTQPIPQTQIPNQQQQQQQQQNQKQHTIIITRKKEMLPPAPPKTTVAQTKTNLKQKQKVQSQPATPASNANTTKATTTKAGTPTILKSKANTNTNTNTKTKTKTKNKTTTTTTATTAPSLKPQAKLHVPSLGASQLSPSSTAKPVEVHAQATAKPNTPQQTSTKRQHKS
ncbi:rna helicase [Pelomyxa schiedti]|nr:rna helicase [Pelomyxa schiedti]